MYDIYKYMYTDMFKNKYIFYTQVCLKINKFNSLKLCDIISGFQHYWTDFSNNFYFLLQS